MIAEVRAAIVTQLKTGSGLSSGVIDAKVYGDYPDGLELATQVWVVPPATPSSLILGHGQTFRQYRIATDIAILTPANDPSSFRTIETLVEYMLRFTEQTRYGLISVDAIAKGDFKGGTFTHTRVHLSSQERL